MSSCICKVDPRCPIHGRLRDMDSAEPTSPFMTADVAAEQAVLGLDDTRQLIFAMQGRMRLVAERLETESKNDNRRHATRVMAELAQELRNVLPDEG